MDFRENKFEIGVALLAVVFIAGMFRFVSGSGADANLETEEISYEMPRPKSDLIGEFGLGDREIDRQYMNPFDKKSQPIAATPAPPLQKKAVQKPIAKTGTAKASEAKKPESNMRVVDAAKNAGLSPDFGQGSVQEILLNKTTYQTTGQVDDSKKDDILSPDQWRALLSGQPTKENMDKLAAALANGETDEATFYGIVEDLLKSQSKDKQSLAVYGLRKVQNAKSFMFASHLVGALPADVKSGVEQFLQSYSDKSKHSALMQVLQSKDRESAVLAANVVLAGLKTSGSGTDSRGFRGEPQTQSTGQWQTFVPLFQRWANSGDASLQALAASILALIPSATTV